MVIAKNNSENFHVKNLQIAREFSKKVILEMKEFIKAVVIFGSNSNNDDSVSKNSDIDIMVVLDNISVFVADDIREAYHLVLKNIINNSSSKIHVLNVNMSEFWDMSRNGDPLIINILRTGYPIFDRGIIEPMQYLLEMGKIKSTRESILNYSYRALKVIEKIDSHIELAVLDLYYSLIDISYAILMLKNIEVVSPKQIPDLMNEKFSDKKIKIHIKRIKDMYELAKEIEHKHKKITGEQFDLLKKESEETIRFFNQMINDEIISIK